MMLSEVDRPDVVREVTAAFREYEAALMANDVDALNRFFWDDDATVRFGVLENLYGWAAIAEYRRGRPPASQRRLHRTRITTFGPDTGLAVTEYEEENAAQVGRQTQVWVRLEGSWRIVSAHVSLPPLPGTTEQI
jgi:ketosteroid isomerase-like protein